MRYFAISFHPNDLDDRAARDHDCGNLMRIDFGLLETIEAVVSFYFGRNRK